MINRKNWLWWLTGGVIFCVAMPVLVVILAVVVLGAAYFVSLRVHPFITCRSCGGSGRHGGLLFGWAHRQCVSCGGQGRHRRLGTIMFHRRTPVWAENRAATARDRRRARPL